MEPADFLSAREVRALLGNISEKTLARYREKHWHCGIHYVQPVHQVLYIKPMIIDWILNGKVNPMAHQRAMEAWLAKTQQLNPPRSKHKTR